MELITAQMLWKDYNPRSLPLDETVLRTEHTERYSVKHIYFNGEATADGCTRIYARLYSPASIPTGASVVLMNDVDEPFDETYTDLLIECGYTVLVLDYAGKRAAGGAFTIYPPSLSAANWYAGGDFTMLPKNPKTSALYVYACVMMRGYVYLENQPLLDSNRICFFGVRRGAFQVYKAAFVLPEAACAVALFNSSLVENFDENSDEGMAYNICLANTAYAPLIKTPLYMVESSNNRENSLLYTSALYAAASGVCRAFIAEHSDNALNSNQKDSLIAFMNTLCFSHQGLPSAPKLAAKNSERALYYEIKVYDTSDIESVKLYYSYGEETGSFRNWTRLNLERVSEDEYIAKADVYLAKAETSAFVTVVYKDGLALSGEVVTKNPYLMGVAAKEIVKSRLVYDVDMGTDDWLITSPSAANGEITVKEGKNGINGVTSSAGTITTLKIGDVHTCGERDSLLQLLVYSAHLQTLDVEVTCRTDDGYVVYSAIKKPEAYEEWSKITLSADEFKSPEGPMIGWDNAVSITVNSEDSLLINSLLWI